MDTRIVLWNGGHGIEGIALNGTDAVRLIAWITFIIRQILIFVSIFRGALNYSYIDCNI